MGPARVVLVVYDLIEGRIEIVGAGEYTRGEGKELGQDEGNIATEEDLLCL